jgi:hypothetical protein
MITKKPSKSTQLVELQIPVTGAAAGNQTTFKNQPQLQSVTGDKQIFIRRIQTYSNDMMPVSPWSNLPVAAPADIINAVLVLNVAGTDFFKYISLSRLCNISTNTGAVTTPFTWIPFELDDVFGVDWTQSYVQLLQAAISTPIFCYMFDVDYDYGPNWNYATGTPING